MCCDILHIHKSMLDHMLTKDTISPATELKSHDKGKQKMKRKKLIHSYMDNDVKPHFQYFIFYFLFLICHLMLSIKMFDSFHRTLKQSMRSLSLVKSKPFI